MLEINDVPLAEQSDAPAEAQHEAPVSHKERFIREIIEFQLRGGDNHDIYEERLTAEPPTEGFEDVRWTRRSYIAIFFDEANWSFHRRIGGKPSVAFNISEGHAPNRTFFDACDLDIHMPRRNGGEDKRSAIFFVNHMKDSTSGGEFDPAGSAEQRFKFDMYLRARYAGRAAGTVTVIFDPTGTNQGPPETP